jgi:hypothetical protein
LPSWKRWSAAGFFLAGLGLLLLVAFGPLLWGEHFDAQVLKTPALGLIAVAVYVLVGINLPAVDWGGVIARIVTALVSGDDKGKGTGDG